MSTRKAVLLKPGYGMPYRVNRGYQTCSWTLHPTDQHLALPKGTASEKSSAKVTSCTQPSSFSPGMSHQGLGYPRSPDDTLEVPISSSKAIALLLRSMQFAAYCPKSLLACLSPSISSNLRTRGWTPASSEPLPALPVQQSLLAPGPRCSCFLPSLGLYLASPWPKATATNR